MAGSTVSAAEVARFSALAPQWWDPSGPMRPLHQMNPSRIAWISTRIRQRFPQTAGLRMLDVGCGAGLAAEALARRGLDVLGIDVAEPAIAAARTHAERSEIAVTYRVGAAEELLAEQRRFPVVTALEVIEHVPDVDGFLRVLAGLMEPGGLLFLSTLNRTPRSFVTAKLGAEYLLRLLPAGTHDWRQFIRPAELAGSLRGAAMRVIDAEGLQPTLGGGWRISRDLSVNYIVSATAG